MINLKGSKASVVYHDHKQYNIGPNFVVVQQGDSWHFFPMSDIKSWHVTEPPQETPEEIKEETVDDHSPSYP